MAGRLLQPGQRIQLEKLIKPETPPVWRRCAQILLDYDEGQPTRQVAANVSLSRGRVRYWRRQFCARKMALFPENLLPNEDSSLRQAAPPTASSSPEEATPAPREIISPPSAPGIPSLPEFLSSAKTFKTPGVVPEDSLAEAGRKVWRYHFAQMLLHEEGTRLGEDIEELHDMRVATRRMRAGFEVFGDAFKKKALKSHLKGLRATGRALGRVRDLDVFMEKARDYLETQAEDRQGLQPLIQTWEQQREAARQQMIAFLDSASYRSFKEKFYTLLSAVGAGVRPQPEDRVLPHRICEVVPVLIYSRLAAVRAFEAFLDSASIEQLHALRIEFKKLRYSVEFFREVLGEEAKAVISDLKEMQDHLGNLNDAQVATQILRDFLGQWDLLQAGLPVNERQDPQPIMAYLSFRYAERHQLMITFQEAWQRFNRPEFRQNLARAISVL